MDSIKDLKNKSIDFYNVIKNNKIKSDGDLFLYFDLQPFLLKWDTIYSR